MRLYTHLSMQQVTWALREVKNEKHVAEDVYFVKPMDPRRSRGQWVWSYEIQLGTYCKTSLPEGYRDQYGKRLAVRRYKNTGDSGAGPVWAATWHEWGWFMTTIFDLDPDAKFGTAYPSAVAFHAKTRNEFRKPVASGPAYWTPNHP